MMIDTLGGTRTAECTRTSDGTHSSICTHSSSTGTSGTSRARAYRPLPACDLQQPGDTLQEYAARVLRFLLRENCTATLSDEQLAQADTAAQRCAAQVRDAEGNASRLNTAQLLTLDRLSSARHVIAQVLAWRRQEACQTAPAPPGSTIYPAGGSQYGRPAPLSPPPHTQPPSPAYALPDHHQHALRRF